MNQGSLDPNADRSADMMPTQSPFMKYVSPFPKKASTKAPVNFKAAIVEAAKDPENTGAQKLASALPRKNKFCGGMSKPYGKKK